MLKSLSYSLFTEHRKQMNEEIRAVKKYLGKGISLGKAPRKNEIVDTLKALKMKSWRNIKTYIHNKYRSQAGQATKLIKLICYYRTFFEDF